LQVKKAAAELSAQINAKRRERGLRPRPVRAVVVGFPNVGKSALINRLLNRRACASAPKPGVTRDLRWIRIGADLDLLDAPGANPPHDTCHATEVEMQQWEYKDTACLAELLPQPHS
jgi:ribosome biogenesis GTPase A